MTALLLFSIHFQVFTFTSGNLTTTALFERGCIEAVQRGEKDMCEPVAVSYTEKKNKTKIK